MIVAYVIASLSYLMVITVWFETTKSYVQENNDTHCLISNIFSGYISGQVSLLVLGAFWSQKKLKM